MNNKRTSNMPWLWWSSARPRDKPEPKTHTSVHQAVSSWNTTGIFEHILGESQLHPASHRRLLAFLASGSRHTAPFVPSAGAVWEEMNLYCSLGGKERAINILAGFFSKLDLEDSRHWDRWTGHWQTWSHVICLLYLPSSPSSLRP